jgi:hypothetical protein
VAYSNQLIEHLHPEDAARQTTEVCRALKPGGVYVCVTPNQLNGPHDISRSFDTQSTGLHLKEYSIVDLKKLFIASGFQRLRLYARARGFFVRFPIEAAIALENFLALWPVRARRAAAGWAPFRAVLGIWMVAVK